MDNCQWRDRAMEIVSTGITREDLECIMGTTLTAEKVRWLHERMSETEQRSGRENAASDCRGTEETDGREEREDRIRTIRRCAEEITGSGGGISLGEVRVREKISL